MNTAGDTLIRRLLIDAGLEIENDLETFIRDGSNEKLIDERITSKHVSKDTSKDTSKDIDKRNASVQTASLRTTLASPFRSKIVR